MPQPHVTVVQRGSFPTYVHHANLVAAHLDTVVETHRRQDFDEIQPGVIRGTQVVSYRQQGDLIVRVNSDHFATASWHGYMTLVDIGTQAEFDETLHNWRVSTQ